MSLSKSPAPATPLGLWHAYLHHLVVNPVRTKALTSASAASLATILAQLSIGVPITSLNWTAVRNQALLGLIRGPVMHYWMELLTKLFSELGFKTPQAQTQPQVVAGKMALDQLLFAPAYMIFYMYALGTLEHKSSAEIMLKISNEFWPLLKMNWKIWPIVSIINFRLVPPHFRVLSLNIVGVAWMVFVIKTMAKAAAAAAAVKK